MSLDPRMDELVHSLDGIVWEADPATTRMLFVSRQAEHILGYPTSQWLEEPTFWVDHIHPDDRDWTVSYCAEATRNQQDHSFEYRMIARDGRTVWLQDLVTVVIRDGKVERLRGVMVDITRRKEAETRVGAIQQRWGLHIEQTPLAVIEWSMEGQVISWNPSAERIFGYPASEAIGQPIIDLVVPKDVGLRDQVSRIAESLIKGVNRSEVQHPNIRKDGRIVICQWFNTTLSDDGGRPIGVASMALDVTDLHQATSALKENEQRFRTVADFTYDWEYWISKDGGVLWMSPSCERVTGYPPEAFAADLGLLTRILHPEDQSMFKEHIHESREGGDPLSLDFRILHKEGHQIWISHICVPVFDLEGRPMGWRVSNRDITDRRRAEEDLLEASRQRLSMLEAASVARVVPWSMGPDHHMHWGDSANLVLGQSPTAMGSQPGWPLIMIQEEDRPRLQQALREADMGFVASFECRMHHGDGHTIWARWTIAHDQDSFHGAVQDITEQHAIQEQLLQSQKLESVGTLVGGIAHDFNNLLGAILGYCELFEADPELNARHRKGLGVIQGAANRGRELVGKLMGFSRKVAPNRVKSSLNNLVSEAGDLVSHALPSGVQLLLELSPNLPDTDLDPGQIHQVVMNLVINARDAIQGAGLITLRTGRYEIGPERGLARHRLPGTYVYIEVEDTGCGIPDDQLTRVFEPFYTTKGLNGTGLGLSVVYGLVTEHGGFMECKSQVDHGTRFRVMLPVNLAPVEGGETPG